MEIFVILCILFLFGIFLRIVGKIQIKKFASEKVNEDVIVHRRMERSRIPHLLVKDNIKFRKEEMTQFYPIEVCVNDFVKSLRRYYDRNHTGSITIEDIMENSVFLIEIPRYKKDSKPHLTFVYNGNGRNLPFHYDLIPNAQEFINSLLLYEGFKTEEIIHFLPIPFSDILYISRGTKK